jgi:hypothetical protein
MAELARFYGIVVAIFFEKGGKHHRPHVHARYAGMVASIAIDDGEVLGGSMHPVGLRLVRQWIRMHQLELLRAWRDAMAGRSPARIEPLR